jgi:DNA invertase Pin-like site-specific DNA recombinase
MEGATMETMDGYVRVSRVMGREGEGYMSPSIQRDDIERWASRHDVSISRIVTEEDVSGGRAVKDRGLEELIKRVEAGASAGVIVNHVDRFGRDQLDAALAIKRLHDAGARLIVTEEGIDSSRPESKLVLNIYLTIAESYRDRVSENWDNTKRRNVEQRGLHVCARAPFGYRRKDQVEPTYDDAGRLIKNAKLVEEPAEAKTVRAAFKMRAEGHTLSQIMRVLGLGSHTLAARITRNRVYLGEARATVKARVGPGKEQVVKEGAHEAIISPELFAAANAGRRTRVANDGTLAEQALLSGLVRCAGCGSKCWVKGKSGTAFYSCSKGKSGGCPSPASGYVSAVDEHVLWLVQEDASAVDAASSEEQRFLEARERVRGCEADLGLLVESRGDLSLDAWRKMVVTAESELSAARAALYDMPDLDVGDDVVTLDGKFYAYAPWGEDRDADRRTLRRYVGSVTIKSCGMNRWVPISQRIEVRWIDGSEPRIGRAC